VCGAITGRYKKRQGQISILHPAVKAADEGMRQQDRPYLSIRYEVLAAGLNLGNGLRLHH
jgi:hypothetical protein